MEQAEEEKRRRDLQEYRDMEDSIGIAVDDFLSGRDLLNKGKEVHPSGKETKFVQIISSSLRIPMGQTSRRRGDEPEGDFGDSTIRDFDLTSSPRIHIFQGSVNKREPDSLLRRYSKRYLFLFSDVLLITTARKEASVETFDLNQVVWMRDLRLKTLENEGEEEKFGFELVVCKPRNKGILTTMIFYCDNELNRRNWVDEIESTLLAFHKDTPKLGWFHDVLLGTFYSAAHMGDTTLLRKHLRMRETRGLPIDMPDNSGMCALHWAVLGGHEVCVRLLLDHGADVDSVQNGRNTSVLLAAARGHDSILRLLIDRGADVMVRNRRDRDAVFMAVVYGHTTKGLPWVLQILNDHGLNLNQSDSVGATPLHVCAERNLARPVKMLVDAGADVNVRHGRTMLTPLLMACNQMHPDVETIRSFLDKGAYPNWRDVQGRSAFDMIINNQQIPVSMHGFREISEALMESGGGMPKGSGSFGGASAEESRPISYSVTSESRYSPDRWRPMQDTIEQVGDWAVRALPALLEITKKGGRFEMKDLESLRPSFRSAVLEARNSWDTKVQPENFLEFVRAREIAGEDLRRHKGEWTKDNTSNSCQLCTCIFGLKLRRHHCRACGSLVCDSCSTKRLQLTNSIDGASPASRERPGPERVCDGCFNRLLHESQQPSPDHFRVRQLRQCAIELMNSLSDLIDSLDDPEGDPNSIQASVRESMNIARSIGASMSDRNLESRQGASPRMSYAVSSPMARTVGVSSSEVLRLRLSKLNRSEDFVSKFLESADGYQRIVKRLIEQKAAASRLWGGNT